MIDLQQYRIVVGLFNRSKFVSSHLVPITGLILSCVATLFLLIFDYSILIRMAILLVCGDVHPNPGPPKECLKLCSINVNSLTVSHKLEEIKMLISDHGISICGICETWLNHTVCNTEIHIDGFNIERNDNPVTGRHGRGVCAYIKDCVGYKRRLDLEGGKNDVIWLETKVAVDPCFICILYRTPAENTVPEIEEFYRSLSDSIEQIYNENMSASITILGDLNSPNTLWYPQSTTTTSFAGLKLQEFCELQYFSQIISGPTYVNKNTRSQLDVVVSDSPALISESYVLPQIGDCHHCPIVVAFKRKVLPDLAFSRKIYRYQNADWDRLVDDLSNAPFDSCYVLDDFDDIADSWLSLLSEIVEANVPSQTVTIRPKDKTWMNSECRKAIRKKNRCFTKFKRTPSARNWDIYRIIRNECTEVCRQAKRNHEDQIYNKLNDPTITTKKYWSIIKEISGNKKSMSIPPILEDGQYISTNKEKATLFNNFFVKHCRLPQTIPELPAFESKTNATISNIRVNDDLVLKQLLSLDVNKATGPDGISNTILKNIAPGIYKHLSKLIRKSIEMSIYPSAWKIANVSPVFKKQERFIKENYRPISLLCNISKVCEKIIFTELYNYFKTNHLFHKLQSAYQENDSTVYQLLKLVHEIHTAIEKGHEVRGVFLDLSKAFDKTWHKGLLFKLRQYGISNPLLSWIESYLSDRKQRVVIKGQASDYAKIDCGVPQGSILGPLLFLIYINDLPEKLSSEVYMFADDTCLIDSVTDPIQSSLHLNNDLEKIDLWADQWLMKFNEEKTALVTFSSKRKKLTYPPVFFKNYELIPTESHKHLGIILTSNLSWKSHINSVLSKAKQKLGVLKMLKYRVPRNTIAKLFNCFVRSNLEYACIIWDGCSQVLNKAIEQLQYHAGLICSGGFRGTNQERILSELSWCSMKSRRTMQKLTIFWKIKNNMAPQYIRDISPFNNTPYYVTRFQPVRIPTFLRSHTNRYLNSFFPSTTAEWNKISNELREAATIHIFKSKLKKHLKIGEQIKYYIVGTRKLNMIHTRFRLNFTQLNSDLFTRNIVASPDCVVCNRKESYEHYFFECRRYIAERNELWSNVQMMLSNLSRKERLKIYLYGSSKLPLHDNVYIFSCVQRYFVRTGRL